MILNMFFPTLCLKGQCHEIFEHYFIWSTDFSWAMGQGQKWVYEFFCFRKDILDKRVSTKLLTTRNRQ